MIRPAPGISSVVIECYFTLHASLCGMMGTTAIVDIVIANKVCVVLNV